MSRWSSCCSRPGALVGEPRPIEHEVKYYEKGDRPLEIVTSRQWYIRNGARDERPPRRAARSPGATWPGIPSSCGSATSTGSRGSTRTGSSAASATSGCPSPSGTRSATTARPVWDQPIPADEAALPVDPQSDAPPGLRRRPARPARRLRGRSRRDGHLGHLVADSPDRLRLGGRPRPVRPHLPDGPASAGTRDHPHLAVLDAAARRSSSTTCCRGRTRASTAGSSIRTARRCPSPRATSSPRRSLVDEHGADGLRYWACQAALGVDTAADPAQMKVGRRLAIKLLNVSKFVLGLGIGDGRRRRDHRSARPGHAGPAGRRGRRGHHRVRRLPVPARPRADRHLLLAVLRRLRRAGQVTRLRRRRGSRARPARRWPSRSRPSSALFAPFLPFATDEVWSWWQDGSVHRPAVADQRRAADRCRRHRRPRRARRGRRRPRRDPQGQVDREAGHAHRGDAAHRGRHRRVASSGSRRAESDVREAGNVTRLETVDGPERVVTVELAPVDADAPAGRRAASPSDPRRSARAVLVGGGTPAPDPGRDQPHPDHDQHRPEHREEAGGRSCAEPLADVDPLQDPHARRSAPAPLRRSPSATCGPPIRHRCRGARTCTGRTGPVVQVQGQPGGWISSTVLPDGSERKAWKPAPTGTGSLHGHVRWPQLGDGRVEVGDPRGRSAGHGRRAAPPSIRCTCWPPASSHAPANPKSGRSSALDEPQHVDVEGTGGVGVGRR